MSLKIGETLGAYRVVEQLGQGGMATVFKAYHASLDRYVAIKVLHAAFKEDPTFQARFQREARVVARLEHLHIVPVYDYAEHNGAPYLVMKFIEGETLKARLQRGPLTAHEVLRCVEALGAALDYAHRQGILHRDIKPSNVMLSKDGTIYLADFGLARITQAGESTLSTDSMLGTPQYMSPEQGRGSKDLDAGTDLYSLGVVIYELLVGQTPFQADTPFAVIHDHIYTPLPPPRTLNPNLPVDVEAVLQKALAKDRAERYATAPELVNAFRAALAPTLGAAAIAPGRTPPADPTAVTPATPTVVGAAPAAATRVASGKGQRRPLWQVALGVGLALVLCLGAGALVRQMRLAAAVPPTSTVVPATLTPTVPAASPTSPADAASLLAAATEALAGGDLEQALALLDQSVALDPTDSAPMIRAGDFLLLNDNPQLALEKFYLPAAALEEEASSDNAPVLQAHASLAYYVLAADEQAREFLEAQAASSPAQALTALALHRYHIFFLDGTGVVEGLEPVLEASPNHAGALLIMADYHLSRGQEGFAIRFYQRVLDLPRPANAVRVDWAELEARCNLDNLRRLRSAATLEATCENLSLLLTGK